MSEIELDISGARAALTEMSRETDNQRHRHAAGTPEFPVTAAGAGFAAHGAAFREILTRLHEVGTQRLDALRATAEAASRQVAEYRHQDQEFSRELRWRP